MFPAEKIGAPSGTPANADGSGRSEAGGTARGVPRRAGRTAGRAAVPPCGGRGCEAERRPRAETDGETGRRRRGGHL